MDKDSKISDYYEQRLSVIRLSSMRALKWDKDGDGDEDEDEAQGAKSLFLRGEIDIFQ